MRRRAGRGRRARLAADGCTRPRCPGVRAGSRARAARCCADRRLGRSARRPTTSRSAPTGRRRGQRLRGPLRRRLERLGVGGIHVEVHPLGGHPPCIAEARAAGERPCPLTARPPGAEYAGMRVALSIAGSDPSGGAGVQADLKTFHAFGVYGAAVITTLTAQNTTGVRGLLAVDPEFVGLQLEAVLDDLPVDAAKTGLLGSAAVVERVAAILRARPPRALVVDPVTVAGTGDPLADPDVLPALRRALVPLATLVTPNLAEAAALTGRAVSDVATMGDAARACVDL